MARSPSPAPFTVPIVARARRVAPWSWRLVVALLAVWVIWGSTFLGIRIMVETIPPLVGSGARFLLGGAVLVALILRARGPRAFVLTAAQWRGSATLGLLLVAGGVGLVALAEQHGVPSSLVALIASSEAAMVLGLRVLAGHERISRRTAIGVAVGLAGVGLLLLPGSRPSAVPGWAMLIALGGSVTWATGTYAGSRVSTPPRLLVGIAIQMVVGGTILLVAGLVVGERFDPLSASTASLLALVGLIVASVAVYAAYGWLLRNATLSLATTQCYVNPVVAVLLGALAVGESLPVTAAAGMVFTLLAVVLVLRAERTAAEPTDDRNPVGRPDPPPRPGPVLTDARRA